MYLFILSVLGLSCGRQDLHFRMWETLLQHADFLVAVCALLVAACTWDLVP